MNSRGQIIIQLKRLHDVAVAAKLHYQVQWIERVIHVVSDNEASDQDRFDRIQSVYGCIWSKGEWDRLFIEIGGMPPAELIELFIRIFCCCRDFDLEPKTKSHVELQIDRLTKTLLHFEKL